MGSFRPAGCAHQGRSNVGICAAILDRELDDVHEKIGQLVRLAAKLTGWKIDIQSAQKDAPKKESEETTGEEVVEEAITE